MANLMPIRVVDPCPLETADLADALIAACWLRYSGFLDKPEAKAIDKVIDRIDSLISSRIFVHALVMAVKEG